MANPSKAKGTRWESDIVRYINDWVGETVCERIVLHGNRDHGDIRLTVDDMVLTLEAKWREKYPPDSEERDFRRQTVTEMVNAGTDGCVLAVNRYRQSIDRAEMWMPHNTLFNLTGRPDLVIESDGEHDWSCMRMSDFCFACFGERRSDD